MTKTNTALLKQLRKATGMTIGDMCDQTFTDGAAPAICPDCGATTAMEPDQDNGYCDVCGNRSVTSFLILAGML